MYNRILLDLIETSIERNFVIVIRLRNVLGKNEINAFLFSVSYIQKEVSNY